jgi:Tol biopolymer transport system component
MKFTLAPVVLAALATSVSAQTTIESVNSAGVQGNFGSAFPAISADGRYVAFESNASNLDPADSSTTKDVFVRDRAAGTTAIASLDPTGHAGNQDSINAALSADGHAVAFASLATNLVPGDTNFEYDIFVRDLAARTLERVSVSSSGAQSDFDSFRPSLSGDGRFVAFDSRASTLVAGDTNGRVDVFVRDRLLGTTERVSISSSGVEGNDDSVSGRLSADGRYVAFLSRASNLVAGDTNGKQDVFVHDRVTGTTQRLALAGHAAELDSDVSDFAVTPDFRWVAFSTDATNVIAFDTNGSIDVFVHDVMLGATERASVGPHDAQANSGSFFAAISADGRRVAFLSGATNLVPGDSNGVPDVFVRDRVDGTTTRASLSSNGAQGNGQSQSCAISADGRWVAFDSLASNLVAGDVNAARDVFLRDLRRYPEATDLCQAGIGGVGSCPCGNPPASAPRGCDNSSGTGGARLVASGSASLSNDTLAFSTDGEIATALTVVIQGDTVVGSGVVFGQGVLCAGGQLRRLYVATASGGSIVAPGPSDLSVSVRSTAVGDVLSPTSVRWYAVYYRDTVVLGGCPAASTFNVTQTQRIAWSP